MKKTLIYVHGKGGSAEEAAHFCPLFADREVLGFDYRANTPWDAKPEFYSYFQSIASQNREIELVANSIGAYFSMCSGIDSFIQKAYFISPVVDMEALIRRMMGWANVTEEELQRKGVIPTDFGEDLSWQYLSYVRAHRNTWNVPTEVLYGGRDLLISRESIFSFAKQPNVNLTVMENGEHWFHTAEQLAFLDGWISKS